MDFTKVILVDIHDRPIGVMDKMEAHEKGVLHRAFSIFLFNSKGEMLLQQRAISKYHSGGLWTNACCSHPAPGETASDAAKRRLREELGLELPLTRVFDFVYRAEFDNGLTEHEFDHVFAGHCEGGMTLNPEEVMDTCYMPLEQLENELKDTPEKFTAWFRIAYPKVANWFRHDNPDHKL